MLLARLSTMYNEWYASIFQRHSEVSQGSPETSRDPRIQPKAWVSLGAPGCPGSPGPLRFHRIWSKSWVAPDIPWLAWAISIFSDDMVLSTFYQKDWTLTMYCSIWLCWSLSAISGHSDWCIHDFTQKQVARTYCFIDSATSMTISDSSQRYVHSKKKLYDVW